MKNNHRIFLFLILWSGVATADKLTWVGCGVSLKAYMTELAKAFEDHTGIEIELRGGGATKGIRNVARGENNMGGSCRMPLRDKSGKRNSLETDVHLHQVAWDAIVVITHPSNPVSDITMDNLRKVYKGEITNWKMLGGPDQSIRIVERESKDAGVAYVFRRYAFSDPGMEFAKFEKSVDSTGPLEEAIEALPFSIGVDGVSSARKSNVKIMSLDGVVPTKHEIATGRYYMFRPLFITTDKVTPDSNTKAFVEFALSEEGQDIISKAGTVNLSEGRQLVPIWERRSADLGF